MIENMEWQEVITKTPGNYELSGVVYIIGSQVLSEFVWSYLIYEIVEPV